MAQKQQYSNVSELLRDVAPDDEFRAEFDQRVARRQAIKHLLALRTVKGLSQKDIAKKLGCSQSRISKLENGCDNDLRLGDLFAYCSALDLHCGITVSRRHGTAIDQIKHHALSIRRILEQLVNLAGSDEVMSGGVAKLHVETLVNLVKLIAESAEKLPDNPETGAPHIRVAMGELELDDNDSASGSSLAHNRDCEAVR